MADDIVKNLTAQMPRHLTTQISLVTRGLQEISDHLVGDIIKRAMNLLQQRRLEEAIATCSSGLEIASNDEILWQIHGVCLGEQGKYAEALSSIDRSLSLDPENPYCWAIKSSLLVNSGRRDDAIACDERAITLDPENSLFREKKQNHLAGLKNKTISHQANLPNIDFDQLRIVVTLGVWWIERAEPFPGKIYVMFRCDIENIGDVLLRLGKELGLYQRTNVTGELLYLGDAVLLPFSPDLELQPQSADTLQLEMELTCPKNETPEDFIHEILGESHNLLGFDHKFRIAIKFSESAGESGR